MSAYRGAAEVSPSQERGGDGHPCPASALPRSVYSEAFTGSVGPLLCRVSSELTCGGSSPVNTPLC